ncbi:hypothetical protein TNCV_2196301 [Trichonephila clavipes]|nr:hypothetical protein TNCV_2196301 [Trichonephila clavipes]
MLVVTTSWTHCFYRVRGLSPGAEGPMPFIYLEAESDHFGEMWKLGNWMPTLVLSSLLDREGQKKESVPMKSWKTTKDVHLVKL